MVRDRSYPPIEGQLDVFDVLELVNQEGLVPEEQSDGFGITQSMMLDGIETDLRVARGDGRSYWVVDAEGKRLHDQPFWSQIECWAFIVGWERSRHRT